MFSTLALEVHFPAEFSTIPNQTNLNKLVKVFKVTRHLQAGEFDQGSLTKNIILWVHFIMYTKYQCNISILLVTKLAHFLVYKSTLSITVVHFEYTTSLHYSF